MKSNSISNRKPPAIVFGLDTTNGLQTARILAQREIPVIGIARDPKHHYCTTNVCEEIIFTDTESDELIEALEAFGPGLEQKAVLVPCNDMNVLPVSRNRHRLEKWYHIALPAPDVVELLIDKTRFYAYALQEGLPIPRTYMLKNRADAERVAQELVFPCITKPSRRSKEWDQNNEKAYKSGTAEDFLALYDRCAKWSPELVVQEWIEGSDSNLYTVDSYFSTDSEPLATFVSKKLRQWPPEMGEGCLGEECRNDVVLQEAVRLFKKVGLNGFGYLEMKRDSRTDKYLIAEPNVGRPTIRSATAEGGGVELLYTMYCDALGWDLPANREQKYGSVKWIFLRRDLQSAFYYWRRGELTLEEWWQSLLGKKVYALFSWTDMGPFIGDFLRAIRLFFKSKK